MLNQKNAIVKAYLDLYETGKVFSSREQMLETLAADLCNELERHKETSALENSEGHTVLTLNLLYLYSTLGKGGGGCKESK